MRIIETNFSVTDNVKVLSPKIKSKNSLFFVYDIMVSEYTRLRIFKTLEYCKEN